MARKALPGATASHPTRPWTCPGPAACASCPLHQSQSGPCPGCDAGYWHSCLQRECLSQCETCGGGRHGTVVAACGRSPLRDAWAELLDQPPPVHTAEPLGIQTPVIPSIYGTALARHIPAQFPHVDAWSVPVHRALSLTGRFRSADMKDYLGLGANQKLLLSTAGPDAYQEMLWQVGDELDYAGHGIDYWFPGHFSTYDGDSKFYQLFNLRRQRIHAATVRSQFVWFRLGEHAPLWWLDIPASFPSVLVSTQQMYSRHSREILRLEVAAADAYFDPHVELFLVGSRSRVSLCPSRTVHEIRSDWLHRGLAGTDLHGCRHPERSRQQMLADNLNALVGQAEPTSPGR